MGLALAIGHHHGRYHLRRHHHLHRPRPHHLSRPLLPPHLQASMVRWCAATMLDLRRDRPRTMAARPDRPTTRGRLASTGRLSPHPTTQGRGWGGLCQDCGYIHLPRPHPENISEKSWHVLALGLGPWRGRGEAAVRGLIRGGGSCPTARPKYF